METEIKEYLSDYFELPLDFITDNAELNTLSVLSLFFKEGCEREFDISKDDIDPQKLSISVKDLPDKVILNKWKIYLGNLLKNKNKHKAVYYIDEIGRDGFSEHLLHMVLCYLEIPAEIKSQLNCTSCLDDSKTVREMISAFRTPQSP